MPSDSATTATVVFERRRLLSAVRITGLGTLGSRILGMLRDVATAGLFGLSGGGVMDAFYLAFRIPNLFRRVLGEGALSTSYLPVFSASHEQDPAEAWRLATATLIWLTFVLTLLVAAGELVCLSIWWHWGDVRSIAMVTGLTAAMLPYLLFICLAAVLACTMHALGHFATPAIMPMVLNVCWIVGVWVLAPRISTDPMRQAYILAGCVVVAGLIQMLGNLVALRRFGARFDYDWAGSRRRLQEILCGMAPMIFALAVTQVNTLCDSLLAWGLVRGNLLAEALRLGPASVLEPGAAAALYYSERLVQFPVGLLGLAVATVVFPTLTRHARRNQSQQFADVLSLGLRVVLFYGIPAGVGLAILAQPIVDALFEHGRFTSTDAARTATMLRAYACGVWAFCGLPIMVRAFYALGDRGTPARVAVAVVGLNLALDVILLPILGESALAAATSISAAVQLLAMLALFSSPSMGLPWRKARGTIFAALAATTCMAAAIAFCRFLLRVIGDSTYFVDFGGGLLVTLAVGLATFIIVAPFLGAEESALLLGHRTHRDGVPPNATWQQSPPGDKRP